MLGPVPRLMAGISIRRRTVELQKVISPATSGRLAPPSHHLLSFSAFFSPAIHITGPLNNATIYFSRVRDR